MQWSPSRGPGRRRHLLGKITATMTPCPPLGRPKGQVGSTHYTHPQLPWGSLRLVAGWRSPAAKRWQDASQLFLNRLYSGHNF